MPDKYNLALVLGEKDAKAFINYAQNTFGIEPAEYLLGTHSIPHVTLCHFEAEGHTLAGIAAKVKSLKQSPITLTFHTQRSKQYPPHSLWGQWSWVSLIPDKIEALRALHLKIAAIVTPTNAAFDAYDPHMTLFNSKDIEGCDLINQSPQAHPVLSCEFQIALGRLDDVGQITEILIDCSAS